MQVRLAEPRPAGRSATDPPIGYAGNMPFSESDLAALDAAEEVEIETRRSDDAPAHRTIIWVVVDDGEVFIRSYRGPDARWYRETLANPSVALRLDGRRIEGRAVAATDDASVQRTTVRLADKYAGDPGVRSMTTRYLDTTLRIDPA